MTQDLATPTPERRSATTKPENTGKAKIKPPERRPDERAKKLDIVDEAGWESFPASDPPPWTP